MSGGFNPPGMEERVFLAANDIRLEYKERAGIQCRNN